MASFDSEQSLWQTPGFGLQLGGSDQMGNILSGLDLLRRTSDSPVECYGMCFPLLTNAEGVKMGKSVDGAIWLSSGEHTTSFAK